MINKVSKEIKKEIMSTDVYVEIQDEVHSKEELTQDIEKCFDLFRDFERRYSRFIAGNELYDFNMSEGEIQVSDELYDILDQAVKNNKLTKGIFNPSILPALINEGYSESRGLTKSSVDYDSNESFSVEFNQLKLVKKGIVYKPLNLKLDLGGIGKGYIVEKVAKFLKHKYPNFVVDAGGDIYFSGKDLINKYDVWFSEILSPQSSGSLAILKLSNQAVATSGVNKRTWKVSETVKNHLIDPRTGKGTESDILTATAVSKDTVTSDVLAKTLVIMGSKSALQFCEDRGISCFLVTKDMRVIQSTKMGRYIVKT